MKPRFPSFSWRAVSARLARGIGLSIGLLALAPLPDSQAASAIVAIRDDGGRVNLAWSYGASKPGDAVATAMSTCRSTLQHNKAKGSCEMVAHYDGPGFIAIVLARAGNDPRFGYAFSDDRQDAIKQAYTRCIAFGEVDCQGEAGHVFWDGGPAGLAEPGAVSQAIPVTPPPASVVDRKKAFHQTDHKALQEARNRASARL